MKELKKQHLEMLQLLESIEVMLQNGDSIHPNSVIRGAIQKAIGMDINLNKMKQTAVQWLIDEILMPEYGHLPEWVIDKVNEAKAMEKEQIINAHSDGRKRQVENSEHYYNETFKSE